MPDANAGSSCARKVECTRASRTGEGRGPEVRCHVASVRRQFPWNHCNLLWEIDTTGLDETNTTDSSTVCGSYTRASTGAMAGGQCHDGQIVVLT